MNTLRNIPLMEQTARVRPTKTILTLAMSGVLGFSLLTAPQAHAEAQSQTEQNEGAKAPAKTPSKAPGQEKQGDVAGGDKVKPMMDKPMDKPGTARFDMQVLEDGSIARLDRKTGAMSLCIVKDGKMGCYLAADEREAYEEEISTLSRKLDQAGLGRKGSSPSGKDSEEWTRFNRAMEFSGEAMRRFYGVIEELRKDYPDLNSDKDKSQQSH